MAVAAAPSGLSGMSVKRALARPSSDLRNVMAKRAAMAIAPAAVSCSAQNLCRIQDRSNAAAVTIGSVNSGFGQAGASIAAWLRGIHRVADENQDVPGARVVFASECDEDPGPTVY